MTKKIRIRKCDVGRFVRVSFMDVGACDGIITEVHGPDDFKLLELGYDKVEPISNMGAPVLALGNYVQAISSGLD